MGRVPARHSYSLSLLLQGLASACISGGISLYGSIDDCFENGVAPAMPFPLEEGEERDGEGEGGEGGGGGREKGLEIVNGHVEVGLEV